MRKVLFLILAILLMAGIAQAASSDYKNAIYVSGHGEVNQPPQEVLRVRYGREGANEIRITSGEAVVWDTTSADGVTITVPGATNGNELFAGIAVTDLLTQDAGGTGYTLDDNYGYICVRGYCIASIDSAITAGAATSGLAVSTWEGALGPNTDAVNSQDVATLLQTSVAGTRAPVWVK